MSDATAKEVVERLKAQIRIACEDMTNDRPSGSIIAKGCEAAGYVDPEDAAEGFVIDIADRILAMDPQGSLIEAQAADLARVRHAIGSFTNATVGDLAGAIDLISMRCALAENRAAAAEAALAKAVAAEREACAILSDRVSETQSAGWAENPKTVGCGGAIAASNTGLFISQAIRARTATQKEPGHEG